MYVSEYLCILQTLTICIFLQIWRRNKGDFFLACVYLNEMSTPFLSVKAVLEKVNKLSFVLSCKYFVWSVY